MPPEFATVANPASRLQCGCCRPIGSWSAGSAIGAVRSHITHAGHRTGGAIVAVSVPGVGTDLPRRAVVRARVPGPAVRAVRSEVACAVGGIGSAVIAHTIAVPAAGVQTHEPAAASGRASTGARAAAGRPRTAASLPPGHRPRSINGSGSSHASTSMASNRWDAIGPLRVDGEGSGDRLPSGSVVACRHEHIRHCPPFSPPRGLLRPRPDEEDLWDGTVFRCGR